MLFQVKYKEKYEKERGKAMLDFETPSYVTAKEAQHMQSQVNTPPVSSDVRKVYNCSTVHLPHQASLFKSLRCLFYINLNLNYCYLQQCFSLLDVTLWKYSGKK